MSLIQLLYTVRVKPFARATVSLAILSVLLTACSLFIPNSDEATTRANAWLDGLGASGLVSRIEVADPKQGFIGMNAFQSGARQTQNQPDQSFIYLRSDALQFGTGSVEADTNITIGFSEAIGPDTTLETLRNKLSFVAVGPLPTPGLSILGWRIYPLTPVSSFKEGVEITGFSGGRLAMRIRTSFFALVGYRKDTVVPADAGYPEGTYFQIKKSFPLDLTLDLQLFKE
jgi:hypothetical protein